MVICSKCTTRFEVLNVVDINKAHHFTLTANYRIIRKSILGKRKKGIKPLSPRRGYSKLSTLAVLPSTFPLRTMRSIGFPSFSYSKICSLASISAVTTVPAG